MGKIINLETPEDSESNTLREELGRAVLQLLFTSNAQILAQAFRLDPQMLISDYDSTPPVPRTIFWWQVGAVMETIEYVYGLSREECNKVLGHTIAELLTLPVVGGE